MPPTGSVPTVAIRSPANTESQPFQSEEAPIDAETARPKKMSAKISCGPNALTAQLAIAPVAPIIRQAEATPPSAEQQTAAPIAFPAWPLSVIG